MEKVTNFNDSIFFGDVVPETSIRKKTVNKKTMPSKTSKTSSSKKAVSKYQDFTFQFMTDTFQVHFQKNVFTTDDNGNDNWCFGNTNVEECVINISTCSMNGKPLRPDQIKLTFIHELTHVILTSGQYLNESYNEPMVEWIAKSLMMTVLANDNPIMSNF